MKPKNAERLKHLLPPWVQKRIYWAYHEQDPPPVQFVALGFSKEAAARRVRRELERRGE